MLVNKLQAKIRKTPLIWKVVEVIQSWNLHQLILPYGQISVKNKYIKSYLFKIFIADFQQVFAKKSVHCCFEKQLYLPSSCCFLIVVSFCSNDQAEEVNSYWNSSREIYLLVSPHLHVCKWHERQMSSELLEVWIEASGEKGSDWLLFWPTINYCFLKRLCSSVSALQIW